MLADNSQRTILLPCAIASGVMCALGVALPVPAPGFIIDPFYADEYEAVDLGSVPGLPTPYGGLAFKAGDPDTLLIGGSANNPDAAIYEIQVTRGSSGEITGFSGTATLFASAPSIDGGLDYGPDGVLFFTTWPTNTIGQILPGSTEPDEIIDLTPLGVASSTGTLAFVPTGFAGAGRLKIASYGASIWYDAAVIPDNGTFDIVDVTEITDVGGGPEGIVYIADHNQLFKTDSVLVSKWNVGSVDSYKIDGNGDPVTSTQRNFISGLDGAYGATMDPVTGEVLFSTWGGGNRVIVVRGFGGPLCPWDCGDNNGNVGIVDFLALLAQWGQVGTPCDFDGGGVGITDFLALLGNWGPCP